MKSNLSLIRGEKGEINCSPKILLWESKFSFFVIIHKQAAWRQHVSHEIMLVYRETIRWQHRSVPSLLFTGDGGDHLTHLIILPHLPIGKMTHFKTFFKNTIFGANASFSRYNAIQFQVGLTLGLSNWRVKTAISICWHFI